MYDMFFLQLHAHFTRINWTANQNNSFFNGFLYDSLVVTSCVYTKAIILFQSRWKEALGIFISISKNNC